MKSIRMIGVFLLVFLFSVSTVYAFEIERRGASIVITNQRPQVELILSKRAGVLRLNMETSSVSLDLYKSLKEGEEASLFIRCTSGSANDVVTFSDKDYETISLLLTNINFSQLEKVYSHFLYSSLNLLQSWPSNLPVFVAIGAEKIVYLSSKRELEVLPNQEWATSNDYVCPPGKELDFPAPECENLCFKKGEFIEGHILYLGGGLAWTELFEEYVEDDPCFGRCGKGCPEDLTGRITYSQRCFDHDGCVKQHGYVASNCNAMFGYAIYDYYNAPICYEIWVSGLGGRR